MINFDISWQITSVVFVKDFPHLVCHHAARSIGLLGNKQGIFILLISYQETAHQSGQRPDGFADCQRGAANASQSLLPEQQSGPTCERDRAKPSSHEPGPDAIFELTDDPSGDLSDTTFDLCLTQLLTFDL